MGQTYVGDSVYADHDGHSLILTTENGLPGDPSNQIILGITELQELMLFLRAVGMWE